jgi:hypothetical protein
MKITGSRSDDWIYWHFGYNQNSCIADLHNLKFTVAHAVGFSVFASRLLVTELKLSHCD